MGNKRTSWPEGGKGELVQVGKGWLEGDFQPEGQMKG